MAEIKITDLVDEKAIKQLQQLGRELDEVVKVYEESAKKLAEGLKIRVEGKEDIDKLYNILQTQTTKAGEASKHLNEIIEKQNEVIGQTTNTISRELAEIEKENAAKREVYTQDMKAIEVAQQILGTRSQNLKRLADINTQLKGVSDAQKKLNQEEQAGISGGQKLLEKRQQLLDKENSLKIAKSELNGIISNEEKMNQAAEGSYTQLSLKLELMKKAYKGLNDEEKQGAEGKVLAQEIANTDAHLKDLSADMGEFQRNVGNYATAQQSVKAQLKEMIGELSSLTVQWRGMSDEEKNSAAGQAMKAKMDELAMKAGKLKDAVSDVKQEVNKNASDTKSFDAINEGVNLLVSGFGAATGAAQMLGLSEKDVQQVQADLQASLAVSNALTQMQTSLQKESALMQGIGRIQTLAATAATKLQTAAQGENVIVTGAATVAQKAFNAVAKANPYVLLAAAILTVVGALVAFTLGTHKQSDAEKEAAEARAKENEEYKKTIDLEYQLADARDKGLDKSNDEITKLRILYSATQDHTKSMKERIAAIDELRKTYPSTFSNLTNEAILAGKAAKEYDNLTSSIWNKAIAEAQQDKVKELASKRGDLIIALNNQNKQTDFYNKQNDISSANQKRIQNAYSNSTTDYYAGGAMEQSTLNNAVKAASEAKDKLEKSKRDASYLRQQIAQIDQTAKGIIQSINVKDLISTPGNTSSVTTADGASSTTPAPSKEDTVKDYDEIKSVVGKYEKEILEMKLSNTKEYSKEELDLTKELAAQEMEVNMMSASKQYNEDLKNLNDSLKAKKITQQQYDDQLKSLNENYEMKISEMKRQVQNKEKEADQKYAEGQLQQISDSYAGQQALRNEQYQNEMSSLKKSLANKKISQEEYDKQEYEATKKYADDTYNATVEMLEKELSTANLTDEEKNNLEKQLFDAKVEYSKNSSDIEISGLEKVNQKEEKIAEERKKRISKTEQALKQLASSVQSLFNAVFAKQIKNIEKQEDELQNSYDSEVERTENLKENKIISEDEAQARKRAAQAKTEEKQKELEKKKAEIEKKQAIFDKATQLAGAVIATARGVMEALAMYPPNIPLAAVVAATGAIQTATIIATPLPSYAKGTERHKGGPALVGDAGKREVISYKGMAWLTPDKPTIINIPEGAKVFPEYSKLMIRNIPHLHGIENSNYSKSDKIIISKDNNSRDIRNLSKNLEETRKTMSNLLNIIHKDIRSESVESYKMRKL